MAKSEKQKLKLLYIMQCLTEKTDAEHSVTTQEIIDYLALQGINAERKSIYTDIDLLIDYGMDIVKNSGRSGGYTLVSRQFELAELKLLVDAVQSSKFITTKKSRDLIGKLETLCSKYEAGQLHRQVVVTNRNKTVNENIYYNVDIIYNAIAENVKIQFQYFEWDVNKEMHLRRNGKVYEVSPWLLTWDDENYYLVGYDSEADTLKHYRVDKMTDIALTGGIEINFKAVLRQVLGDEALGQADLAVVALPEIHVVERVVRTGKIGGIQDIMDPAVVVNRRFMKVQHKNLTVFLCSSNSILHLSIAWGGIC